MTRIDFYVLPDSRPDGRMVLACRIAEKAFARRHRIHVHAGSEAEARRVDDLLWTFRESSFVPHGLAGPQSPAAGGDPAASVAPVAPVVIGHGADPDDPCDLLINLAPEVPQFFSRFERVAELVDAGDEQRQWGRNRFKFYRDRGYDLTTHKL